MSDTQPAEARGAAASCPPVGTRPDAARGGGTAPRWPRGLGYEKQDCEKKRKDQVL